MTLLSRKADYALLILLHLHQHALNSASREGGACAREIAERFGISPSFVANILKELCQKGFVASHRGKKGGYTLLISASAVSLAELLDALDDGVRLAECSGDHADEACKIAKTCPVKGPIALVHDRLRAVLRSVMLDELFRPNSSYTPLLRLSLTESAGSHTEIALPLTSGAD